MRSVPSGTRIILWTTAAVPTSWRSSQPGGSAPSLLTVTRASSRSPERTSSISFTERSCPIASGVIDSGKTTVSLSGSTGRVAGNVRASLWSSSSFRTSVMRSPSQPHADLDVLLGSPRRCERQRDAQHSPLVAGRRLLGVGLVVPRHLTLKRAVLDFHLTVVPARLGSAPLTREDEPVRPGDQVDRLRIDPGQLGDDDHGVVGSIAVDLRPEAAPHAAREREDLPEVGEELLDLLGRVLEIASLVHRYTVPLVLVVETWPAGLALSCASGGRFWPPGWRSSSPAATRPRS